MSKGINEFYPNTDAVFANPTPNKRNLGGDSSSNPGWNKRSSNNLVG